MNRMYLVLVGWVFVLIISCGNNEDAAAGIVKDTAVTDVNTQDETKSLSGCYSMIHKRDTATLNLSVADSNVTGELHFKLFEKDHNKGPIKGIVRDNLIVANYTFQSEGMSSVREVVFSIKNDSLFEGYGEIVVQNDTARFVNASQLTFMKNPFIKVDCTDR